MNRITGSRKRIILLLVPLGSIPLLTSSSLYSQTPSVTIVSVGNEPRSLTIHPVTYKSVVTNHNSNSISTTLPVGIDLKGVVINRRGHHNA